MDFLYVILISVFSTLVSCNEYVPVLLWSNKQVTRSKADSSVFSKISSDEYFDLLVKMTKFDKPTLLVFMEENLGAEDFNLKDSYGDKVYSSLKNISGLSESVLYLPSVENPINSLHNLKTQGYSWIKYNGNFENSVNHYLIYEIDLRDSSLFEDHISMLKNHDEKIVKIYNDAIVHHNHVLAIYSSYHNSWLDNKAIRSKRQTSDANATTNLVIADDKNVVKIVTTTPIVYKVFEPNKDPTVVYINKFVGHPTTDIEKDKVSMTVRFVFNNNPVAVKFEFSSVENEWWMLDSAEILDYKLKMVPTTSIGAPAQHSYFCNPIVEFKNNTATLTFENFQVQPRVGKANDFGPVLHCIPFFSIAIWSGLIVVFILSIVLGWGIVMIMDINTNDRFDDPKGKTITITATD